MHKAVLHHLRLLIKIVNDLGVLAGELVNLGLGELPGTDAVLEENIELGVGTACTWVSMYCVGSGVKHIPLGSGRRK